MAKERKSAIVTGAASGIGQATARRLAANGWAVVAADIAEEELAWADSSEGITAMAVDVTSPEDNARMVEEAEARNGPLDAAVFNAGITGGGKIDEMPWEDFERVMAVNLHGPVLGVRAALPSLRRNGGGAITVTSSTMGLGGDSENWAYGTSKHALIGMVRSVAREVGWEGIRINALCPGPTKTGMTAAVEDASLAHYVMLEKKVALQRWADPDEMASVIEFLVSPAASYVSGHAMVADGGAIVGTGLLDPKGGEAPVVPDEVEH